jgi:hypothetical protein
VILKENLKNITGNSVNRLRRTITGKPVDWENSKIIPLKIVPTSSSSKYFLVSFKKS